jgi:hypothetical protein
MNHKHNKFLETCMKGIPLSEQVFDHLVWNKHEDRFENILFSCLFPSSLNYPFNIWLDVGGHTFKVVTDQRILLLPAGTPLAEQYALNRTVLTLDKGKPEQSDVDWILNYTKDVEPLATHKIDNGILYFRKGEKWTQLTL